MNEPPTPHPVSSPYLSLVERLNRFPQGAPESKSLYEILKILFSEQEADLVSRLPIRPFNEITAAKIWDMPLPQARNILQKLAARALLVDVERDGESVYTLPPPMAGFFEFSMMRYRSDVDQKRLGELFHQYCNVEEDFIRSLFANGETQLGRVYIHEPVVLDSFVMDYERASQVIETASQIGIGVCYCRHKMAIMNTACDAPMDICMTFNSAAHSLIKHGFARKVDQVEGIDLLQQAYDSNLVQFGENAQQGVNFICNCCGCCCEALIAARRFSPMRPIHTTNYQPVVNEEICSGCGKCVNICPVEAMGLVSANHFAEPNRKKAKLDESACLGCGLCARICSKEGIQMQARPERVITPLNTAHRVVMMAIERGNLQNLIFDNRVLWSHRMLSAFLGAVLKLPPLQRTLASRQVKSHYLEALIQRFSN